MSDQQTRARPLGINHVVLEVDDLDQALAFYGALFEFTLRGRSDHNAFIDLGDQFIQLTLGRTQVPDTKRHFGLVVDNREAVRKAMERHGIESINDRLSLSRHVALQIPSPGYRWKEGRMRGKKCTRSLEIEIIMWKLYAA